MSGRVSPQRLTHHLEPDDVVEQRMTIDDNTSMKSYHSLLFFCGFDVLSGDVLPESVWSGIDAIERIAGVKLKHFADEEPRV